MNAHVSAAASTTLHAALACESDIDADDADNDVYDEIETFLHDDMLLDSMPRQGCVELAQALEDVMKLLTTAASDFSDPRQGRFPMGLGGGAT